MAKNRESRRHRDERFALLEIPAGKRHKLKYPIYNFNEKVKVVKGHDRPQISEREKLENKTIVNDTILKNTQLATDKELQLQHFAYPIT